MGLTQIYQNSIYGMMGRSSMYFRFNETIREFLNSMLPNYLYILKNYQIVYLNIPHCTLYTQIRYTIQTDLQYHYCIPDQNLDSQYNCNIKITQPYTIGTVLDDPSEVMPTLMNKDIFWICLPDSSHIQWITFYQFLESIGKDSSEYKELVTLTTGENPFKRNLYGGFNDYTIG